MKYDIFLGGPWEQFAPFPYKSDIKKAFPDKRIFDPEEQPSQQTGSWFKDNYQAIDNSSAMVALIPNFPFPGVGPEAGFFYHKNCKEILKPLENLIIIWPKLIKPDYGKEVAEKMGYLVETSEQAISQLKNFFSQSQP